MKITCRLEFEFADEKTALVVAAAVKADDENFVKTRVTGSKITARISAKSPMSLLHTVDDYLACLSVAEKTVVGGEPDL